jgi:hypothetical protein
MDCRVKPGNDELKRGHGDCRIISRIVRGVRTVACRTSGTPAGPVAQWLEPAAHNGLVAGSSPAGPTSLRSLCGHFENDSISALRTTRFRFDNDSISHPSDTPNEFRLDFFADF